MLVTWLSDCNNSADTRIIPAFPNAFVATSLATFAIEAAIVYIMGEPKTAALRMVTNSMQQPLGSWIWAPLPGSPNGFT